MTGRGRSPGNGSAGAGHSAELVLGAHCAVLTCTRPALELLGGTAGEVRGRNLGLLFEGTSVWTKLLEGVAGDWQGSMRAVLRDLAGGRTTVTLEAVPLAEGTDARLLVRLTPEDEDGADGHVALAGGGVLVTNPRARQRLDLLHAAAVRIGGSLDITENAEDLVAMLVPAFADLGAVDVTESVLAGEEPGEFTTSTPLRRIAVAAADGQWPEEIYQVGDPIRLGNIEAQHVRRGEAAILPNLEQLRAIMPAFERFYRIVPEAATSFLMIPLLARGLVLGGILLWRTGDRSGFEQADGTLAEEIASRLSLSLDNARRYTRERRTAERLQRSLLPRPVVRVTAAETSGTYLPASTAAGTGGSWYDVIRLSGTRIAFVVGRVAGRGVNAAGAMGRLRAAVQTLADLDPAPDELLGHLDDLVVRFGEDEAQRNPRSADAASLLSATCLYATYDPVSRQCLVAAAGHPPPLLARGGGAAAEEVKLSPGPPLGTGGEPFEPVELLLEAGDVLAFHSGGRFGGHRDADRDVERMYGAAQEGAGRTGPLSDVGERWSAELREGPREEDLALLLARVGEVPPGRTVAWELPADPGAVAGSRSQVSAQLGEWGLEQMVFSTELIVSELVTNAVRYAGGPIGLRLTWDERLICEVSDPSQTQPHLRRAQLSDEGGRGLFLVAQVSHRWGSRYTPGGKTIWTEQIVEEL
ncbi:hypothetical protein GCM10009716_08820 [Streptomyces sodiiphilus]|uniref:PPM-type phosphatase domain-containing protein n=1 Tax=Streptomyces sodiiphilus TaxID=226217 RepID=A0ABN2NST5_9ACTN